MKPESSPAGQIPPHLDASGPGCLSLPGGYRMSNRMANVTSMRPNDEFYTLGR